MPMPSTRSCSTGVTVTLIAYFFSQPCCCVLCAKPARTTPPASRALLSCCTPCPVHPALTTVPASPPQIRMGPSIVVGKIKRQLLLINRQLKQRLQPKQRTQQQQRQKQHKRHAIVGDINRQRSHLIEQHVAMQSEILAVCRSCGATKATATRRKNTGVSSSTGSSHGRTKMNRRVGGGGEGGREGGS